MNVFITSSRDGAKHERDERAAAGFDGDGDEVEPRFIEGAGVGDEGREVGEGIERFVVEDGFPVPETNAGICGDWWELEVATYLEERDGDGWGNYLIDVLARYQYQGTMCADFFRRVATPDVGMGHESEQCVCSSPFRWCP